MRGVVAVLLLAGCGRLGFDARLASDADTDAAPASGFSKVIAYADQTCALHEGSLYCWGDNNRGQLGDGFNANRGIPTAVALPAGSVRSFAQGQDHACAIVDGDLFCWGESFLPTPTVVALPATALQVDAGHDFTCALADRLYCWGGDNSLGQLGDTTTAPKLTPNPVAITDKVVDFDTGDDHTCAITDADVVRCWGHNDDGALGFGAFNPTTEPTPVVVPDITTQPRIAGWHACNLQGGAVRCWGRNDEGELGDGTMTDNPTPVLVPISGVDVLATGGGPTDLDATCAASGANVKCWGAGATGRLGDGAMADRSSPVDVIGLPGTKVVGLAIGYGHACALLDDGDLWCWGRGDRGQLGNGAFANSLAPVRVAPPT